ncbi:MULTISPECIES: DUF692 domain-containing protein [unclassified Thioalkalivibrio]|uniref:HvfB family MNIO-type RiPP peptide maturase n=1 Tax=unclassified Thioalkalivibrio TaxID=2621013 RepID=UPI0003824466|nr:MULTISPECIES: DUF692 domain-containing protein [unclassified Thioalkalivibrio]
MAAKVVHPANPARVSGAGLGLRRALLGPLAEAPEATERLGFFEAAPENWMHLGGRLGRIFREYTEAQPFVCHGLSLDIGGPRPLDKTFLQDLRTFLDTHGIEDYSEHLSACGDGQGHLYDLMPIPFTEEAVRYVADRVRQVQDILGRRMALENVSYYTPVGAELDEITFVRAVLEEADCDLLLDVNNIVVNSINHGYEPTEFLDAMPLERVRYLHIAGHEEEAPDLRVDTHGQPICSDVWALLEAAYARIGPVPTLLERDFNFPPLEELLAETDRIRDLQLRARAGQEERLLHA